MTTINIMLVDNQTIVRKGVRHLLENEPDFRVVAEAADGACAVRKCGELAPDVVVLDAAIPSLSDGIQITRQLTDRSTAAKVVVLSGHSGWDWVESLLKAGASGYVLKQSELNELTASIRRVVRGKLSLDTAISGDIIENYLKNSSDEGRNGLRKLTEREREILEMLAKGRSTKEIAYDLDVHCRTVATHRKNIMGKLHLFSIAELTKYAIRQGLTTLDIEGMH